MINNTRQKIEEIVKQDIAREQSNIDLFERVKAVLMRFEGKKITKALATAVEKELSPDGFTVYYRPQHGMFHLAIWKDNHNDRIEFLLGYDSNPIFHIGESSKEHSGFEYYNTSCGDAARARNAQRVSLLADDAKLGRMAMAIDGLKQARAILEEFDSLNTPSIYSIRKELKVEE